MLNSLKKFDKSSLKKTATKITTETGDQFVEFKNFRGFVVDLFADIQVGEILPGLILGMLSIIYTTDIS